MSQWQPPQYDPQAHRQRIRSGQPQQRGNPGQVPPRAAWQAPARTSRPARGWPPYPAHQTRFPWQALPRSRRRGRSLSLYRAVYLGRHPVALMIAAGLTATVLAFVYAWVALVVMAWAFWAAAVTAGWLCQVAAAAVRRR